jgi:catechol 2,3-dioxygenase-like lactoylglutathione lyase family enzyme
MSDEATQAFTPATVDLKLEVVIIPVADVDRSKQFYQRLGWRLDADFSFDNGFRVVQLTPPGSGCSIQLGTKLTNAVPGSVQDLYLVVADIEAARAELIARGAEVSDVFHPTAPGGQFQPNGTEGRAGGRGANDGSYRTFATFTDPDGNGWLIQEVKTRLPGRGLGNLDIPSLTELSARRRTGMACTSRPRRSTTGRLTTPVTSWRARWDRRPTKPPRPACATWKATPSESRHSSPVHCSPTTSSWTIRGNIARCLHCRKAIRWSSCSLAEATARRTGDSTRGSYNSTARCWSATAGS